jgi:hypothetical protein
LEIKKISVDELSQLKGEGLVLQGCGGDPEEWVNGINEMLTAENILLDGAEFKDISVFEHGGSTNILFSMEDVKLDVSRLAMWRIHSHGTFGGTWLSDYIPNQLGINRYDTNIQESDNVPVVDNQVEEPSERDIIISVTYSYAGPDNEYLSETVDFPASEDTIRRLLENAGIDGVHKRVFFMESYESVIVGLSGMIDTIQENADGISPSEVNSIAKSVQKLSDIGRERFAEALTFMGDCSVKDIIEAAVDCDDSATLRVNVGNVEDERLGEITISLPASPESIRQLLEQVAITDESDIAFINADSPIDWLGNAVFSCADKGLKLGELNYLAERLKTLSGDDIEIFSAVLAAGWHTGSVAEMINLTENLKSFYLQPAFDAKQYGEHLLEVSHDDIAKTIERLMNSEKSDDNELSEYIERLEAAVDAERFGQYAALEEKGVFTDAGYITKCGEFKETYHSQEDIPAELRVFTAPSREPTFIIKDVEIAPFIMKLHAVADCPLLEAQHSLAKLAVPQSSEYLLLLEGRTSYLTEAVNVYQSGTEAFETWLSGTDNARAFAIHIADVHGHVSGDIVPLDYIAHRYEVLNESIHADKVFAVFDTGSSGTYTPDEWEAVPQIERDNAVCYTCQFNPKELQALRNWLEDTHAEHAQTGVPVSEREIITEISSAYMRLAENPQPAMLRITRETAKEILARSDAAVYSLRPEAAVKLAPIDAVNNRGLWYINNREFAIKREDIGGLEAWAKRKADDIISRIERRDHKKSFETEK